MLTYHRRPVCLSLISTDLPILSTIETAGTLYQKEQDKFHLLFNQPDLPQSIASSEETEEPQETKSNRLFWLEISPYRVIMTMQGNSKVAYRHFWEKGVYGISRYWLNDKYAQPSSSFRLRNFTRSLKVEGYPLPRSMRVEYELWSSKVPLGHYIVHLEIHH